MDNVSNHSYMNLIHYSEEDGEEEEEEVYYENESDLKIEERNEYILQNWGKNKRRLWERRHSTKEGVNVTNNTFFHVFAFEDFDQQRRHDENVRNGNREMWNAVESNALIQEFTKRGLKMYGEISMNKGLKNRIGIDIQHFKDIMMKNPDVPNVFRIHKDYRDIMRRLMIKLRPLSSLKKKRKKKRKPTKLKTRKKKKKKKKKVFIRKRRKKRIPILSPPTPPPSVFEQIPQIEENDTNCNQDFLSDSSYIKTPGYSGSDDGIVSEVIPDIINIQRPEPETLFDKNIEEDEEEDIIDDDGSISSMFSILGKEEAKEEEFNNSSNKRNRDYYDDYYEDDDLQPAQKKLKMT